MGYRGEGRRKETRGDKEFQEVWGQVDGGERQSNGELLRASSLLRGLDTGPRRCFFSRHGSCALRALPSVSPTLSMGVCNPNTCQELAQDTCCWDFPSAPRVHRF